METVDIPIDKKVYRGVQQVELSDFNYEVLDGYLDEMGGTQKRPGLSLAFDIGLGTNNLIDGLFWWEHQNKLVTVAGGKMHFTTYDVAIDTFTTVDLGGAALLNMNEAVSFATDGTYVYAANGGRIAYSDGSTSVQYIADTDAPDEVTHIAYIDTYLLANHVGENRVYYSNVLDPLTWTAGDRFSAAGDADHVRSLIVHNREIYILGDRTIEIWESDGQNPFSRIPGGFIETGVIAPDSVLKIENGLFWLNNNRRFVEFGVSTDGVKYISTPYDRDIQNFSKVDDCIGMRIEIDGKPFLVFTFPSQERTLVYNYMQDDWSEWRYYLTSASTYERWLGNSYQYSPEWGFDLVGSREDSKVYFMGRDYYDDAGNPIRLSRTTGHIDYGTSFRKRTNWIRIRVMRGGGELGTTEPKLMIRWRDDNKDWSNEHYIGLGFIGENEIVRRLHVRGMYRTRQYQLVCSDAVPVAFVRAEEDIDVLDR